MSSTVYLPGSVTSVFVGQTNHQHLRSIPSDDNIPTAIKCDDCEKYLVRDFAGVYDKRAVPLTDRQIEDRQQAKEAGEFAVARAAEELARGSLEAVHRKRARAAAH